MEQDRLDALTEANGRLIRRIGELERRVAELERLIGSSAPQPAPVVVSSEAPSASRAKAKVTASGFEARVGLTWVNRIAVLTCMLAAAFAFKYAVDNNWIGPFARVALGIAVGLVLLALAEVLFRRDQKVYAQGLSGLGLAVLFLAVQAGYALYGLLGQPGAFLLMMLVSALAVWLALRYASEAIGVLGLVGGFMTPVLLASHARHLWFFLGYVLLLDVAAVVLRQRRGWLRVEPVALAATILLYGNAVVSRGSEDERLALWLFLFSFYGLFSTRSGRYLFYAAQVFACLIATQISPGQPAWVLAALSGLAVAGLIIADSKQGKAAPLVVFAGYWLAYGMTLLSSARAPVAVDAALLTISFLLFLGWLPWRLLFRQVEISIAELALTALNAGFYFTRLYELLGDEGGHWGGLAAIVLAALHGAVGVRLGFQTDRRARSLLFGIALVLLTLAAPIEFSGYRVTMAWALEGAALAWIAARTRSAELAWCACGVLLLGVVRLVSVDAALYAGSAAYTSVLNLRFLTFLMIAASCWAASRWLLEALAAKPVVALAVYAAGHVTLLGGLILEATGLAERTAAPENLRNFEAASTTILIAAYAVSLVAIGAVRRSAVNRLLGLTFAGMVVVKLYLYDVWNLRLPYRVAAFAGLGPLLMVLSYIYSATISRRRTPD